MNINLESEIWLKYWTSVPFSGAPTEDQMPGVPKGAFAALPHEGPSAHGPQGPGLGDWHLVEGSVHVKGPGLKGLSARSRTLLPSPYWSIQKFCPRPFMSPYASWHNGVPIEGPHDIWMLRSQTRFLFLAKWNQSEFRL